MGNEVKVAHVYCKKKIDLKGAYQGSHMSQGWPQRGILSNWFNLQNSCLRSFELFTSLNRVTNLGKFSESSNEMFKTTSRNKALVQILNKTPHVTTCENP